MPWRLFWDHQVSMLVQDAREHLKSSQHELAAIQKQRDDLARQLAHIAEKISSGMIPDLADLTVPEHIKAAAEASASTAAVRPMPNTVTQKHVKSPHSLAGKAV